MTKGKGLGSTKWQLQNSHGETDVVIELSLRWGSKNPACEVPCSK